MLARGCKQSDSLKRIAYSLGPVPWSLKDPNRSIYEGCKAVLVDAMERYITQGSMPAEGLHIYLME